MTEQRDRPAVLYTDSVAVFHSQILVHEWQAPRVAKLQANAEPEGGATLMTRCVSVAIELEEEDKKPYHANVSRMVTGELL